jgi:hypothetical protein
MAEASTPPWAGDAGQHKEVETASAPAPVSFTDAAVTSTLSGQPVLSGAVAGASAYAGTVSGKSAWQKGTYWRFAGMACGLQLILAALLLSTTLSLLGADDVYSYETVEVEVVDGKGDVRLNPDGDLHLSSLSRSYTEVDYYADYWYNDDMWLDYGVSVSYGFGYSGDEGGWDADMPRSVLSYYNPVDFDAIALEVSHDWDNRSLSIVTDLWLNHSNTTSTLHHYQDYQQWWEEVEYDLTPVSTEGSWTVNYSAAGIDRACYLDYFEFLVPHSDLENDERVRLVLSLSNCRGSDLNTTLSYFEIYPYVYDVEVGEWSPDNSTLWFDHEQLGNTTLTLEMEFGNTAAMQQEDRRRGAMGTMLTLAPILSLLGLPILTIVGGLTKGRSAAWGATTGFLLMPASFIFWLWASFTTW